MSPYELGESGDKFAIDYIVEYLKSGIPNEKRLAASAINKLSKKFKSECIKAVPYLLKNLNHKFPQVRQYTLKALLNFDLRSYDLSIIPTLLNDLKEKYYNKYLAKKIININCNNKENYKKNYKEFKEILESYKIQKLFHFTDEANLDSIKKMVVSIAGFIVLIIILRYKDLVEMIYQES